MAGRLGVLRVRLGALATQCRRADEAHAPADIAHHCAQGGDGWGGAIGVAVEGGDDFRVVQFGEQRDVVGRGANDQDAIARLHEVDEPVVGQAHSLQHLEGARFAGGARLLADVSTQDENRRPDDACDKRQAPDQIENVTSTKVGDVAAYNRIVEVRLVRGLGGNGTARGLRCGQIRADIASCAVVCIGALVVEGAQRLERFGVGRAREEGLGAAVAANACERAGDEHQQAGDDDGSDDPDRAGALARFRHARSPPRPRPRWAWRWGPGFRSHARRSSRRP